MSYSSSKRHALDQTMPLPHRMSNARSCAMRVGQKHHVRRSVIIAEVQRLSGVDLMVLQTDDCIERAIAALDQLKDKGIEAPPGH